MRRTTAIASVACTLLLAAPAATSATTERPTPRLDKVEYADFTVGASDGLSAKVEARPNRVVMYVGKGRLINAYTVPGELSARGLEARFGELGRVSVEFRPLRTVSVNQLSEGCEGETYTTAEGVFSGTIRFRGEGGYVTVDTARAKGRVESTSRRSCPRRPGADPFAAFEKLDRESEFGRVAVLQATDRHRLLAALAVDTEERHAAFFYGGARERRGRMEVLRLAGVKAPLSAFTFNHVAGTATLTPPAPFTGSATFQRNADGSKSWTGSLSVSLLGSEPVFLAGPRFRAGLVPDFNED